MPRDRFRIVAPYRFNPLGAHVDHQGGSVLARTLDRHTALEARPLDTPELRLAATFGDGTHTLVAAFDGVGSDGAAGTLAEVERDRWQRYALGMAVVLHRRHRAPATVSLKRLPPDEMAARSSVRFAAPDEAGLASEVLEIVEKPAPGTAPSAIGANLMFVLPTAVLPHVARVRPSPRGEREVQVGINAWLAAGGRCRGLVQATPPEWTPPSR